MCGVVRALLPPAATCWDTAGPGWIKLGQTAAPEPAELCRARLGAAGREPGTGGTWPSASGDLGSRGPAALTCGKLRVHPKCGVLPVCGGRAPFPLSSPPGPLGAGPAPAPSLEGVMCQHRARDKDSDCFCV